MEQIAFSIGAMPPMDFDITKIELDSQSPLNHNEAHIHKRCEVYINLSGDVSFAVENRLYSITRGSVIITRPSEQIYRLLTAAGLHRIMEIDRPLSLRYREEGI